MKSVWSVAWLSIVLVLVTTAPLSAHALGAECTLKNNRLQIEAYYSDDMPARHAKVRLLDGADEQVAAGRTDDAGRWSTPAPPAGVYRVIVDAGAGHRARLKVTVPERDKSGRQAFSSPISADGAKPNPPNAAAVSEGPMRAEFTRFPWLPAGMGVAVIAVLGRFAWRVRRISGNKSYEGSKLPDR